MKTWPRKPGVFGYASFETSDNIRVARLRLDRWRDESIIIDEHGRPVDDRYRPLVIVAMNPSEACADFDDLTVAKGIGFAKLAGANGVVLGNITPEITTDPKGLGSKLMPYGTDERQWETIDALLSLNAVHVVAAWGLRQKQLSSWNDRVAKVVAIAADVGVDLMCFGTNDDGSPKHPSRISYESAIVPWRKSA